MLSAVGSNPRVSPAEVDEFAPVFHKSSKTAAPVPVASKLISPESESKVTSKFSFPVSRIIAFLISRASSSRE